MPRIPNWWARAGYTYPMGSQPARSSQAIRRIPVPRHEDYVNPVTVDLGNDGMAPQVTFTGAGTAIAFIGPSSGGDLWSLDQCSISTSVGALDPAQASFFVGPGSVGSPPPAQYLIAGSLAGGLSQFGLGGVAVPFGWFAWAVWTGGTAGSLGFLRLTGVKTVLTN